MAIIMQNLDLRYATLQAVETYLEDTQLAGNQTFLSNMSNINNSYRFLVSTYSARIFSLKNAKYIQI